MRITLVLDGKRKAMEAEGGSRIGDLLRELGINRETVLVRRNREICVEEEEIEEGDEIEVIRAISGG
jgi:sulfur carrier protein